MYLSTVEKSRANSNGFEQLTKDVSEIHALVSSSKALLTWTARDAIQEAREACGGHVSQFIVNSNQSLFSSFHYTIAGVS